jgi:hypothetical protein
MLLPKKCHNFRWTEYHAESHAKVDGPIAFVDKGQEVRGRQRCFPRDVQPPVRLNEVEFCVAGIFADMPMYNLVSSVHKIVDFVGKRFPENFVLILMFKHQEFSKNISGVSKVSKFVKDR